VRETGRAFAREGPDILTNTVHRVGGSRRVYAGAATADSGTGLMDAARSREVVAII